MTKSGILLSKNYKKYLQKSSDELIREGAQYDIPVYFLLCFDVQAALCIVLRVLVNWNERNKKVLGNWNQRNEKGPMKYLPLQIIKIYKGGKSVICEQKRGRYQVLLRSQQYKQYINIYIQTGWSTAITLPCLYAHFATQRPCAQPTKLLVLLYFVDHST